MLPVSSRRWTRRGSERRSTGGATVNRKARADGLTASRWAESMRLAVLVKSSSGWRPAIVVALASYSGLTRWF